MRVHPAGSVASCVLALALWCALGAPSAYAADKVLTVAYAGSMGRVMNHLIGPAFAKQYGIEFRGVAQGSFALAHLLTSRQMRADVFVGVTPGPMRVVLDAGLAREAIPIASTEMVIAYSPRSRYAADFHSAAQGKADWYRVLERPGIRFGRTDPVTDPQGRNIVFTVMLAAHYYDRAGLMEKILGAYQNPAQIFAEPVLLARLEAGQLDATSSYRANAQSHRVPYVRLPDEINLSKASFAESWYTKAEFSVVAPNGSQQAFRPEPLVFYAAALADSSNPGLARKFVEYLAGDAGRRMLRENGYDPPTGARLS